MRKLHSIANIAPKFNSLRVRFATVTFKMVYLNESIFLEIIKENPNKYTMLDKHKKVSNEAKVLF